MPIKQASPVCVFPLWNILFVLEWRNSFGGTKACSWYNCIKWHLATSPPVLIHWAVDQGGAQNSSFSSFPFKPTSIKTIFGCRFPFSLSNPLSISLQLCRDRWPKKQWKGGELVSIFLTEWNAMLNSGAIFYILGDELRWLEIFLKKCQTIIKIISVTHLCISQNNPGSTLVTNCD